MAIFTVTPKERAPRVLVVKDRVSDTVASAIKKLKLPAGDYELYLDDNGTLALVDEDEILQALSQNSQLVIVAQGEEFDNKSSDSSCHTTDRNSAASPRTSAIESQHVIRESVRDLESIPLSIPTTPSFARDSFPWVRLADFEERLEYGSVTVRDRKEIIHSLATHLVALNDFSRKTCRIFTDRFFCRYPDLFPITDPDGCILSSGNNAFLISLYERVNFVKPKELKTNRKRRREGEREATSGAEDEPAMVEQWPHTSNPRYDSYSCVAWAPQLDGHQVQVMERKRVELMAECDNTFQAEDRVDISMASTCALQRKEINKRRGGIKLVLDRWPFLYSAKYLLNHSSTLLGISVRQVWSDSVGSKSTKLFGILQAEALSKNPNASRMKDIIAEADSASINLRSNIPLHVCVFPLLCLYFREELSTVLTVVDESTTDEVLLEVFKKYDRPLLAVKGRSIFSEDVRCSVGCEGQKLVETGGIMEGMLLLFCTYYSYNYNYPEQAQSYFECLQRVFMKINPPSGHKEGPKARRKLQIINPKVRKLIQKLSS